MIAVGRRLRLAAPLAALGPVLLSAAIQVPGRTEAAFDPPRIAGVINQADAGNQPDSVRSDRRYLIDKGLEHSINRGDVLNVYRETRLSRRIAEPLRFFIGTMTITETQVGSSIGLFTPNAATMGQSVIKYKTALKGDIVVPRLIIDSSVLFDPGKFELKPKAVEEFQRVAEFVKLFSPAKLVIEGHTDADGDEASNLQLSEQRAAVIRRYLFTEYDFITPAMVEAKGYGEVRPIVPNDTPENKALNRRIEVIVWE